jgi:hypothetical protein
VLVLQKAPELTITYEDAAEVILDNLSKAGASPIGESGSRFLPGCASTRMMCHANSLGKSCAARGRTSSRIAHQVQHCCQSDHG